MNKCRLVNCTYILLIPNYNIIREYLFYSGPATKRGGGLGLATKKMNVFEARKKKYGKNVVANKLEWDGE